MTGASASPEWVGRQADVLEGVIGENVKGEEGQGDEAGNQPREPHSQVRVASSRRPTGGMEDQLVTLQSDEHQGEDRHCHRHALNKWSHLDRQKANILQISM